MSSHAADDLITRYLDDAASEQEMAELNRQLVDSAEVRRQFRLATEQAMTIAQPLATSRSVRRSRVRPFPKGLALVAACMALMVVVALLMQPKPMARVVSSIGEVEMPTGGDLFSGDTIQTTGGGSSLMIEYRDGSRVRLSGNTMATLSGEEQKRLLVHEGGVLLKVKPQQASSPMVVTTPTAEITVLGTEFGVVAMEGATRLEVSEGAVNLEQLADGQQVRVKAGEYSVAGASESPLTAKAVPDLDDQWSVDFREPPLKGRPQGRPVYDAQGQLIGLGGVPAYGAAEVAGSRNAWQHGDYALFKAEEDTVLKLRLKMERPQWLNFIVNYRSSELGSSDTVTCLYQDPMVAKVAAGEWVTVEIPLADPKNPEKFEPYGGQGPAGWYCFSVSVSAGDEVRGLVIERIWTE